MASISIIASNTNGSNFQLVANATASNFQALIDLPFEGKWIFQASLMDRLGLSTFSPVVNVTAVPLSNLNYIAFGNLIEGMSATNSTLTISGVLNAISNQIPSVSYRLDNGLTLPVSNVTTSNFSLYLAGLPEGQHSLELISINGWNDSNSTPVVRFMVDLNDPMLAVSLPTNGQYLLSLSCAVSGTVTDSASGIESVRLTVDGSNTFSVGKYHDWASNISLPEGVHILSFQAYDHAGRTSAQTNLTVSVDATPPVLAVTNPASLGYISSPSLTVKGFATDTPTGVEGIYFSTNGSAFQKIGVTSWSQSFTLTDGTYSFVYRAVDKAGNVTETNLPVTLDRSAPSNVVVLPTNGQKIADVYAQFSGLAFDDGSGIQGIYLSLDSGVWSNIGAVISGTNWNASWQIPDGNHTLSFRCSNFTGYVSATTAVSVFADKTPPSLWISSTYDSNRVLSSNITFSGLQLDTSSAIDGVYCSIDGGSFDKINTSNSWSYIFTVTEGVHTFSFHSRDVLGNTSAVTNISLMADWTPPELSNTLPTNNHILPYGNIAFSGKAQYNTNGIPLREVLMSMDGGTNWTHVSSLVDWSTNAENAIQEGSCNLYFKAVDEAGQESPVSIIRVHSYRNNKIYVATNGSDLGGGTINEPFRSLDTAFARANYLMRPYTWETPWANANILLTSGLYTNAAGLAASGSGATLTNQGSINIYGNYNSNFSATNGRTILQGNAAMGNILRISNCVSIILNDLIISKCSNANATQNKTGAGVLAIQTENLSVNNVSFISNFSRGGGAGLELDRCTNTTVDSNCTFSYNYTLGGGGGIGMNQNHRFLVQAKFYSNTAICGGAMNVSYCSFGTNYASASNNIAFSTGGILGNGGAFYYHGCTNLILDTTNNFNMTTGQSTTGTSNIYTNADGIVTNGGGEGGAVYMDESSNCTITGWYQGNKGRYGGAVYVYGGYNNSISGNFFTNTAYQRGGGIFLNNSGYNTIVNAVLNSNVAPYNVSNYGDNIGCDRGTVMISNNIFSNYYDRPIHLVQLSNVSIINNEFNSKYGSIYIDCLDASSQFKNVEIISNRFNYLNGSVNVPTIFWNWGVGEGYRDNYKVCSNFFANFDNNYVVYRSYKFDFPSVIFTKDITIGTIANLNKASNTYFYFNTAISNASGF